MRRYLYHHGTLERNRLLLLYAYDPKHTQTKNNNYANNLKEFVHTEVLRVLNAHLKVLP